MPRAKMIMLCVGLSMATAACSNGRPASAPSEAKQDELIRYRASLADLRRHPLAAEATVDLEKAEAWLQTAQGQLGSESNKEKLRLYLDAVQAQLVKVKSFYARREAQQAGSAPERAPRKAEEESNKEESP